MRVVNLVSGEKIFFFVKNKVAGVSSNPGEEIKFSWSSQFRFYRETVHCIGPPLSHNKPRWNKRSKLMIPKIQIKWEIDIKISEW